LLVVTAVHKKTSQPATPIILLLIYDFIKSRLLILLRNKESAAAPIVGT
jgi:hypothetical protein